MKAYRRVLVFVIAMIVTGLFCSAASARTTSNATVGQFDYTLRQLTDADLKDVDAITTTIFGEEKPINQFVDYRINPPRFIKPDDQVPFDGFGFGIEVDGKLVGHITAGFLSTDYLRAHALEKTFVGGCYISEIAVLESYRRAGLAEDLMEAVKNQAEPATLSLHVMRDNNPAIKLYKKLGYQIDETRSGLEAHFMVYSR